jgi:hypothetical protein
MPVKYKRYIVWDGVNRPAEGETREEHTERLRRRNRRSIARILFGMGFGTEAHKPLLLHIEEAQAFATAYRTSAADEIALAEDLERQIAAFTDKEGSERFGQLPPGPTQGEPAMPEKYIVWDGANRPAEGMTFAESLEKVRKKGTDSTRILLDIKDAHEWCTDYRHKAADAIAIAEDIERQIAAFTAK